MNHSPAVTSMEHIHQHQPLTVQGVPEQERDALIISTQKVSGYWIVLSHYRDDRWQVAGQPTNTIPSVQGIDFGKIPEIYRATMKAILYRYICRGRSGQKRPSARSIVKLAGDAIPFLRHLERLGIARLADVTPVVCSVYVDACKKRRTGRLGQPLKASSLGHCFSVVEAIYELSQYTDDRMRSHPWPGTSATHLAGLTGVGTGRRGGTTPLIPDDVFTVLFQKAWSIVEKGNALLDLRDKMGSAGALRADDGTPSDFVIENLLKRNGWSTGVGSFRKSLRELRTAAYIVIAAVSGCRNHELAFIQSGACYSTQESPKSADDEDRATTYWWMRSRSTKTDAGRTEWMVPEAAVIALRIMERWAQPYQNMIKAEISERREINPFDPEIIEAKRHAHAVFLAIAPRKQNQVRTMSSGAWGLALKAFARECGLTWDLATHQFRRKFANYAARSQFGDLRYLREHFKHWSLDMTLGYALNQSQELALYIEIQDELDDIKAHVVDTWLQPGEPLAGGYGKSLVAWRGSEAVVIFKNHKQMVRSLASSTPIRSNGHAWCTADDDRCVGNDMERTRCSNCDHSVIGRRHAKLYQGLHEHLAEVLRCNDIGEAGLNIVRRDMERCRNVLAALGHDIQEVQ
ncbi:TPA: hypothetical protein RJR39_001055 [Burkholderia cenocepacia]|uniref:integrase n=1 Tax=Burkholderia TaxID=32008 RepID=UPI001589DBB0|nr:MULTISPECIES: integrase [Burkholderia]MBR8198403.1 hypothetical protein [Burkholderia cenocepacia]HDV6325016.1 hypothetical protein [Burkholderia cenocepacia]HDV6353085.1 hypothetical protein [Burkholderia cenocepacia]